MLRLSNTLGQLAHSASPRVCAPLHAAFLWPCAFQSTFDTFEGAEVLLVLAGFEAGKRLLANSRELGQLGLGQPELPTLV